MISLIKAIHLMDFNDDTFVWFCTKPYGRIDACISVHNMRKHLDMKHIKVKRISHSHFWTGADLSWEFVVSEKDFEVIKKFEWR